MRQALVVFKRCMVQLGFMIEFSFIAIGLSLGVILAYLLLQSPELSGSAAAFSPPWRRLGVIILAAYAEAVLMTYLPAQRAGRVPVAEVLRFV